MVAACMSLVPMAKPTHSSGRRTAFSLMEVIVATAVLAAAGAALFALIGQASQLARKAQRRTDALQVATSVMDEAIAVRGTLREGETTAVYESLPDWQYRITCEPFGPAEGVGGSLSGSSVAGSSVAADAETIADANSGGRGVGSSATLRRIIVEVFPAGNGIGGEGVATLASDAQATVRLVRVVRALRTSASTAAVGDSDSDVSEASFSEGANRSGFGTGVE